MFNIFFLVSMPHHEWGKSMNDNAWKWDVIFKMNRLCLEKSEKNNHFYFFVSNPFRNATGVFKKKNGWSAQSAVSPSFSAQETARRFPVHHAPAHPLPSLCHTARVQNRVFSGYLFDRWVTGCLRLVPFHACPSKARAPSQPDLTGEHDRRVDETVFLFSFRRLMIGEPTVKEF